MRRCALEVFAAQPLSKHAELVSAALKVLLRHAKPKEHATALRQLFWEHRAVVLGHETCAGLAA